MWVYTQRQRYCFNCLICTIILISSTSLTALSYWFRDFNFYYLDCIGAADDFYDQTMYPIRVVWLLPLYHPFHVACYAGFFGFTIIVPIGYALIYRYRKKHDGETAGINEDTRKVRNRKNLVTTRMNLLIWICETLSGVLLLLTGSKVFVIAYFLIPNAVSPILYYVGIEMNRQAVKKHVKQLVQESKRIEN